MMDLVILGVFAFWLGKNFDGFDFDFSQNQDGELEPTQNQDPARFTEWEQMRKEVDPKYPADTYSLWARKYMQMQDGQEVVLFEQYQIRKNGNVFRSGYRDLSEAVSQLDKMIRPRTPEEQARIDEAAAQKNFKVHTMYSPKGLAVTVTTYEQHLEYQSLGYTHEKPPAQPMTFEDYSSSKGGAF